MLDFGDPVGHLGDVRLVFERRPVLGELGLAFLQTATQLRNSYRVGSTR
jgi:hypothetical protein